MEVFSRCIRYVEPENPNGGGQAASSFCAEAVEKQVEVVAAQALGA